MILYLLIVLSNITLIIFLSARYVVSRAIVVEGDTNRIEFDNLEQVLAEPGVQMRIFGKPEIVGHRRMGVILATDESVEAARDKAERAYQALTVNVLNRE